MGDIIKRTSFYELRKLGGKEIIRYLPFYRVEIAGNQHSQLFQPINFQVRRVGDGVVSIPDKIEVDEYKQITPCMRFFMDDYRQLMNFESCEWPAA